LARRTYAMKHVALSLTVALLLTGSAVAPMLLLPVSQAQPTTLLSVDFTGSSLPQGWFLQGSAKFIGGLNSSSGFGGIQLVNNASQAGAVVYGSPFTTQNVVVEFSGMYEPGSPSLPEADDIGLGFYSDGPSANVGPGNPAPVNGYYASYEFSNLLGYVGQYDLPSLTYNAHSLSSNGSRFFLGGRLPSTGRNYLFAGTTVTPTSVSMNALTRTDNPWTQELSISLNCLRNLVTYNNATGIDGSHAKLYVGGATFSGLFRNPWSYEYVYWLRILSYPTTPTTSTGNCTTSSSTSSSLTSVTIQPSTTQSVAQTITSTQPPPTQTQTVTPSSNQTVSQTQTTPPPVLSSGGASSVLLYAVIGAAIVAAVVLVGVFLVLRRRDLGGPAKPTSGAPKLCKSCGNPLSGPERFCDRCGAQQV